MYTSLKSYSKSRNLACCNGFRDLLEGFRSIQHGGDYRQGSTGADCKGATRGQGAISGGWHRAGLDHISVEDRDRLLVHPLPSSRETEGKNHWPISSLGAGDARERAKELRREIDGGVDIAVEKQRQKQEALLAITVDILAAEYFAKAEKGMT